MSRRHLTSTDSLPVTQPGLLRIYSMRYCPYAERSLLVANHKGIKHEVVNINLSDKPGWMLERNPNGTVPIVEKDGQIVYESAVVMEYLDESFPGHNLNPADPYAKARGKIIGENFSKIVIGAFYKLVVGAESEKQANTDNFLRKVQEFEKHLPDSKFLCGGAVSMADYFIWPFVERCAALDEIFNVNIITAVRCPKLHTWTQAMLETPGVKGAMVPTSEMKTFLISMMNRKADYDFALE